MEIVKKNILSIICGVVALLALVASVWPLGGMKDTLNTELTARTAVYSSLQSLKGKTRHAPVVNPDNPESETLSRFPNDDLIKEGETIQLQFQTESKKILD